MTQKKDNLNFATSRRFAPLFGTQFLGAFNDNLFKTALFVMISFYGLGKNDFLPPCFTQNSDAGLATPTTGCSSCGFGLLAALHAAKVTAAAALSTRAFFMTFLSFRRPFGKQSADSDRITRFSALC